MTTFGERLRTAIEVHQAISITEYARQTGFTLANLSHFMSGQRQPRLPSLVILVAALPDVDVRWLVTGLAS